jgi:lysozyme
MTEKGYNLLKKLEGLRLKVYEDVGGIKTVGYGSVKPGLKLDDVITEAQAESWLKEDVKYIEQRMHLLISKNINENQWAALVCFIYNVGLEAFRKSTLLKRVNDTKFIEAAQEFTKWDKVKGVSVMGLYNRRLAEQALFLETVC